jgi:hypothetical protein
MGRADDSAGKLRQELVANSRVRDVRVLALKDGREFLIVLVDGLQPVAGIPETWSELEVYVIQSATMWSSS